MREVDYVLCSCGGEVEEVETTDEEDKKYGCSRKGCCAVAFQCKKCQTRFLFALNAPEAE